MGDTSFFLIHFIIILHDSIKAVREVVLIHRSLFFYFCPDLISGDLYWIT